MRSRKLAGLTALAATSLALILAPSSGAAHIYWANQSGDTIGRAGLDGGGVNQKFISGATTPRAVAIDGAYVYWAQGTTQGSIGRARLNGTGKDQAFISTGKSPHGVTLDSFGIYWTNTVGGVGAVGHSSLGGFGVNESFIPTDPSPCGVTVDPDKLYWANGGSPGSIGRAHGPLDVHQDFLTTDGNTCGVAVTKRYVYWANRSGGTIGRATRDGTRVNQRFIVTPSPCGVAANESRIYWTSPQTDAIGTSRLDGTRINPSLIDNAADPCGLAIDPTATASPSAYTFSATPVGQKGPIHAFFIQNTSSSVLDVRRVSIGGRNPGDFTKTGDGCTIVNTAAGGGCIINVRFWPTAPGDRRATIDVTSNASNSPTSIAITGFGS
jgi:hypothetical protein